MSDDGITSKERLQAELFPDADADPLNPLADPAKLPTRRGPGRPPGAINTATREMRDYLAANFTNPVIARARVMMMNPHDLAKALGCTPLEAFDRIERAREYVGRFTNQELPKAIEIEGGGAVVLNIGVVGSADAESPVELGKVTIAGTLAAPQQDQALSATKPAELDARKLDE